MRVGSSSGLVSGEMQRRTKIRAFALAILGVAALASAAPALAQYGGVVVSGGYYGGYRGSYYGGYRGYYGYRGWYGGYYYPWGWGGGGPGPYLATSPYYYSTYSYGGVPYYYPGNAYVLASPAAGPYLTVAQAPGVPQERRPVWSEVIAYPKNGQSPYQQATDRYECYRWAVAQIGYDPTSAGGGTVRRDLTDYNRAQTACLTARGYSVRW
jgi:hypothetical protein